MADSLDDLRMRVRRYGTSGPFVIVLHGGPGAPGYVAPVARGLADAFRVIEPFQRGSSSEPLTVTRHVADLHDVVEWYCGGARPAIVGHSWGAMLALAYGASHPRHVTSLVLIGCGTFDPVARARMRAILDERTDDALRVRLRRLPEEYPDSNKRLKAMGDLLMRSFSHELIAAADECEPCDARAHEEAWDDMLRLQAGGVYPAAFAAIDVPVLMLHGAVDPHPGQMIRRSLEPHLRRLEYREWERCGHYPWLERAVREEFFAVLRDWLTQRFAEDRAANPG